MSLKDQKVIPITDKRMTRFMITLHQGVELVWEAFDDMHGGEIYVKKIPSMNIVDIAKAIAPHAEQKIIGIRPGEKIHEQMIGYEDADHTYEYKDYYKVLPAINNWSKDSLRIKDGEKVKHDFSYSSDNNEEWMDAKMLNNLLKLNPNDF